MRLVDIITLGYTCDYKLSLEDRALIITKLSFPAVLLTCGILYKLPMEYIRTERFAILSFGIAIGAYMATDYLRYYYRKGH